MQRLGPYEVLAELGRGGAGAVLRARDAAGREVALKVLLPGAAPHARKRFLREARALARLRHPGVVGVVDVAREDDRAPGPAAAPAWIAMELVPGETLAARLAREGPLPPRAAVRLAERLADAVAHVHAAGVLHRDINPRNVILRPPGGEPVLADLGLTRDVTPTSQSRVSIEGLFLGTPGYWPPEQARGDVDAVGVEADVYGVGATLYAALTGRPPFLVESLDDALRCLVADPLPPSRLRAEVDAALDALVLRCLARAPGDRVPTAAALAEALRGLRRGSGAGRGRAAWLESCAAAAVVVAVLVAVGALATPTEPPPETPTETPAGADEQPPETPEVADAPVEVAPIDAPPAAVSLQVAAEVSDLVAHAMTRLAAGDRDEAEATARRALALWPEAPRALGALALVHYQRGERGASLELLDRAVAGAPTDARLLGQRGILRFELDDAAGSIDDLTRAIEHEPGYHLAWHNRAISHLALGDGAAAVADADRALAINPEHAPAHYIRGKANVALERLAGAEADAGRAVALRPRYGAAWLLRAEVRTLLGDLAGALADLRQAVATLPAGSPDRARAERALADLEARRVR
ncbi:MAG: protein kinase [Planctomycetes bacterium]|nr:protein kinase [Planctomycetota bacterium]